MFRRAHLNHARFVLTSVDPYAQDKLRFDPTLHTARDVAYSADPAAAIASLVHHHRTFRDAKSSVEVAR
jgi:hypothetical protein